MRALRRWRLACDAFCRSVEQRSIERNLRLAGDDLLGKLWFEPNFYIDTGLLDLRNAMGNWRPRAVAR